MKKMGAKTEVYELSRLAEGRLVPVFPLGLPVLLVRRGDEVFALENRCAHMGCPLSSGSLDGYALQCPCHDWRFDVRTGKFVDAPELSLRTYAAETRDGKVFLELL